MSVRLAYLVKLKDRGDHQDVLDREIITLQQPRQHLYRLVVQAQAVLHELFIAVLLPHEDGRERRVRTFLEVPRGAIRSADPAVEEGEPGQLAVLLDLE